MGRMRGLLLVCLIGCGDDGGQQHQIDAQQVDMRTPDTPAGMAHGTAKMLNGASPGAVQFTNKLVAPAASDGNWQISPTKIVAPIVGIEFRTAMNMPVNVDVTNCKVTFDLTQPGLEQSVTCPFDLPAGTYTGAGVKFDTTFDVLIDDSANGIYTDPTATNKLVLSPPGGGAQPITLPNPRATLGAQVSPFGAPLTVADGDAVTVSVVLDALQKFQININAGVAKLGADANGMPGFADGVTAVGTPAKVAYYVNNALGDPYSYNGSALGGSQPLAISVLYSSPTTAAFLGGSNGNLPNCGPFNVGFYFAGKGNGYLGMDTTGTIGWAGINNGNYAALMRMVQKTTLGQTTTFECQNTTTDPMPPGDSFASGAPNITPAQSQTMTLVAN